MTPKPEDGIKKHPFYKKRIAFTGDLQSMSVEEAAVVVQSIGGEVQASINKKTHFVIVGDDPESRYMRTIDAFIERGTKITLLNEQEFLQLLK